MEKKVRAQIQYSQHGQANCLATVTWQLSQRPDGSIQVLKCATDSGSTFYVSVTGTSRSSAPGNILYLHSRFASSLNLQPGSELTVVQIRDAATNLQSANISCVSSDDWEILETNAETVRNNLLHQVRVVFPGLEFPFWVTRSLCIKLRIQSLSPPSSFGILCQNSDIIIPSLTSADNISINLPSCLKLRLHPICLSDLVLNQYPSSSVLLKNIYNAFINRRCLLQHPNVNECLTSFTSTLRASLNESKDSVNVTVYIVEECDFHSSILQYFPVTNPSCLYVHPELFKLEQHLEPKKSCWLQQDMKPISEHLKSHFALLGNCVPVDDEYRYSFCRRIIQDCVSFLKASLSLGTFNHSYKGLGYGSIIIEGKQGSGKSWLSENIAKALDRYPYFVHYEIVSCSKWRGKKAETVEKELKLILEQVGNEMCPGIIVLDDLDSLVPAPKSEHQVNPQEDFLLLKLCETLMDCLMPYKGQQLGVIATTTSKEALNSFWKSRKGFHFFQKVVSIPPPTQMERYEIVEENLSRYAKDVKGAKEKMMETFASLHDQQATPQFLHNIARKWAILGETVDLKKIVEEEMVEKKQSEGAKLDWHKIRGLKKVKQALTQILEWPIKYAELLKNTAVRLPSGVLLYGYPGTGKTLLGLAIPSLLGNTNFIHIKGPELLSKYIGASEQAVQDVFKRARNSSPCVIFFDEFDSLVPRRGHDSTGVTDRVVNQFLAEMDGIEGGLGNGVYLVAATSRPDLIDPAVLRPGRLDKHLFFDLPTKEERLEIVEGLQGEVNLRMESKDEVKELENLIGAVDGLTGADLVALLSSAQLTAVSQTLKRLELNEETGTGEPLCKSPQEMTTADVPLSLTLVKETLSTFKPSLQGNELKKFKMIYENFSGVADKRRTGESWRMETGKRATLA